jgi:hypothetical protein
MTAPPFSPSYKNKLPAVLWPREKGHLKLHKFPYFVVPVQNMNKLNVL